MAAKPIERYGYALREHNREVCVALKQIAAEYRAREMGFTDAQDMVFWFDAEIHAQRHGR